MTSPVYVRIRTNTVAMAIKRMRKQCIPGALSLPPSRLGTRLVHTVHALQLPEMRSVMSDHMSLTYVPLKSFVAVQVL